MATVAKTMKVAPEHPKYDVMIKTALLSMKEKTGSSVAAITKYLGANYKLPLTYKKTLSTQLKNLVKSGKLEKVKASYKLSDAFKKPVKAKKATAPKKVAPKKVVPKKVAAKKVKVTPKKAPKKVTTKKSASAPKAKTSAAAPKTKKMATKPKAPKKAKTPTKAKASKPKKASAPKAKKA